MGKAIREVVGGLLLAGSPDPSDTKWFSVAVRLRAVLLGIGCHSLLPRVWVALYRGEAEDAEQHAAADDAANFGSDFAVDRRKRHRRVNIFFEEDDLKSRLLSALITATPTEKMHFTLCKADVARKTLRTQRVEAAQIKKVPPFDIKAHCLFPGLRFPCCKD